MSFNYKMADEEVQSIAHEIISKYHPDLVREKIAYVVKYGSWTKDGKEVLGSVKKCSEKETLLSGYNFVITLNEILLNSMVPENTLRAVIDHELSHCRVTLDDEGNKNRIIIGHDLEDFADVIGRYGMYKDDIKDFFVKTRQISLFDRKDLLEVAK